MTKEAQARNTARARRVADDMVMALREFENASGFRLSFLGPEPVMMADYDEDMGAWKTIIHLGELIDRL